MQERLELLMIITTFENEPFDHSKNALLTYIIYYTLLTYKQSLSYEETS